jgi:putative hydrolase of the HAD superfamily
MLMPEASLSQGFGPLGCRTEVDAVLFDLDGTLFDRDSAIRTLVEAQYLRFAQTLAMTSADFVERVLDLDDHGHRDKTDVYRQITDDSGLAARLTQDFWAHYHRSCRGFEDTLATLKQLRLLGKQIAVVTNGRTQIQEGTIDALAIRPFLDAVLISEREGLRKPGSPIFMRALDALGVTAARTCHVGDHPVLDVAGARAAGLHAIWKRVPYWPRPVDPIRVIEHLSELFDHLA